VTGRKDRRGAVGLERMLASLWRTGSANGLSVFSSSARRCLSAFLRFLKQTRRIDRIAPTRSNAPIPTPAKAPPLIPPPEDALLVEVELAADAVFEEDGVENVRELVAARRGAELARVVFGAIISEGSADEVCTTAVLLAADLFSTSIAGAVEDCLMAAAVGVCFAGVGVGVGSWAGASEVAGTTTGAGGFEDGAARTAGGEVAGSSSAAATPTVV
jgi:hypothetical protein